MGPGALARDGGAPVASPWIRQRAAQERGLTAAEYLGALVLVAFVLVVLFSLGIGGKIASGIERAVYEISGDWARHFHAGVVVFGQAVTMRALMLILLFLATAAWMGACGGDDGGAIGREEYIRRADALCARLGERTRELADRELDDPSQPPSTAPDPEFRSRARALQRDTLAQLRALPRPPGDKQRLAELYDELERGLERLDALPPDDPGPPGADPLGRFHAMAAQYGMRTCAAT